MKFHEFAQLNLNVLRIRASARTYDTQRHTRKLNQLTSVVSYNQSNVGLSSINIIVEEYYTEDTRQD